MTNSTLTAKTLTTDATANAVEVFSTWAQANPAVAMVVCAAVLMVASKPLSRFIG